MAKVQNDLYFYHLGSGSWITDSGGHAIQHLQYLPFGETRVDQRTTIWSSRYTFSAKEKDEESGYGYFGARYYDSDISIWLSVDPMSDKYPGLSPYNYCANNPIRFIDPDGRDWYTTDSEGNISLYKKIDGSKTDHLVVLDRKGNVRLDKNGDPKKSNLFGKQLSQEVSKGVLHETPKGESKTMFDFKGNKSEATGVFNLLSDNTNVEWGIVGYKEDGGDHYQVGSSHNSFEEGAASQVGLDQAATGSLLLYNHSHPWIPSEGTYQGAVGGSPSNKDRDYWGEILKNSPKASLGIRFRGGTDYHHNNPFKR